MDRSRRGALLTAGLVQALLASLLPTGAHARPERPRPRISREDTLRARNLFFRGLRAFQRANYPDALTHFKASWKINPKNIALYNIAMCYRALFQYRRSIAAFEQYLRRKGRRLIPYKRRIIQRFIKEMESKLGRLKLLVTPPGAEIRVDGRLVGRSPLEEHVLVDPGIRIVKITLKGWRTATLEIDVGTGKRVTMGVRLTRLFRMGGLMLTSRAVGATVRLDGGPPRSLPLSARLRAGPHKATVQAPGHAPRTYTLRVIADQTIHRQIDPQASSAPEPGTSGRQTRFYRSWWFWTIVSVAVAAAATTTGVVLWDRGRNDRPLDMTWQLR